MAYIWGFLPSAHSLASGETERMKDPRGRSSGLYSSSFALNLSFMLRLHYILFENKFLCLKRNLDGNALLCRLSKLFHQIFYVMTTFYNFPKHFHIYSVLWLSQYPSAQRRNVTLIFVIKNMAAYDFDS